jgi:hypothetical protein
MPYEDTALPMSYAGLWYGNYVSLPTTLPTNESQGVPFRTHTLATNCIRAISRLRVLVVLSTVSLFYGI